MKKAYVIALLTMASLIAIIFSVRYVSNTGSEIKKGSDVTNLAAQDFVANRDLERTCDDIDLLLRAEPPVCNFNVQCVLERRCIFGSVYGFGAC